MTVIDESLTAKGYTPAAQVPAAFGVPRTIQGIVIHHWGERGQTHDGVNNFFVNGPGQTSAHYVVSAGRINCLVSPEDAAWHCPGKNATHIGIECRPEATDGDYATVAELIRTLRAQYGNLPLSMHRDWYNTACPGVWDLDRLDALARGTITLQSESITPVQEDDMDPNTIFTSKDGAKVSFNDFLNSIDAKVDGIPKFDRDVRATFDVVRAQNAALVAANGQLVELLAASKSLSVDEIKAALSSAIADGIKVTVEAK